VRDQRVVATGYNGPPVGVPHCESCIRKEAGYKSGERLDWCPALHAEQNCINTAAYLGVITKKCTLYMNSLIPCFNCFKSLINSGIIEVIVEELTYYSPQTQFLAENSTIKVRTFDL
jgi:dCMP deaminase